MPLLGEGSSFKKPVVQESTRVSLSFCRRWASGRTRPWAWGTPCGPGTSPSPTVSRTTTIWASSPSRRPPSSSWKTLTRWPRRVWGTPYRAGSLSRSSESRDAVGWTCPILYYSLHHWWQQYLFCCWSIAKSRKEEKPKAREKGKDTPNWRQSP